MTKKQKAYSICLLPEQEDYKELSNIISKLSRENMTPVFQPHITVYSTECQHIVNIHEFYQELLLIFKPFSVSIKNIMSSGIFTKALYFNFEYSEALYDFYCAIHDKIRDPGFYFNPHLSLLYCQLPEQERMQIKNNIAYKNNGKVIFDRIQIIEFDNPVENSQDIENWRYLYHEER